MDESLSREMSSVILVVIPACGAAVTMVAAFTIVLALHMLLEFFGFFLHLVLFRRPYLLFPLVLPRWRGLSLLERDLRRWRRLV